MSRRTGQKQVNLSRPQLSDIESYIFPYHLELSGIRHNAGQNSQAALTVLYALYNCLPSGVREEGVKPYTGGTFRSTHCMDTFVLRYDKV
jgi:hypothetical protein